jgi:hypothetical protein
MSKAHHLEKLLEEDCRKKESGVLHALQEEVDRTRLDVTDRDFLDALFFGYHHGE